MRITFDVLYNFYFILMKSGENAVIVIHCLHKIDLKIRT